MDDMMRSNTRNDDINSMKVPQGVVARIYACNGFNEGCDNVEIVGTNYYNDGSLDCYDFDDKGIGHMRDVVSSVELYW